MWQAQTRKLQLNALLTSRQQSQPEEEAVALTHVRLSPFCQSTQIVYTLVWTGHSATSYRPGGDTANRASEAHCMYESRDRVQQGGHTLCKQAHEHTSTCKRGEGRR